MTADQQESKSDSHHMVANPMLEKAFGIAASLLKATNLADFYELVVKETFRQLKCEVAALYVLSTNNLAILERVAVKSVINEAELDFDREYGLGEGLTGSLVFDEVNIVVLNSGLDEHPKRIKSIYTQYKKKLPSRRFEHYMAVPLQIGTQRIGVLKALNKKDSDYNLKQKKVNLRQTGFTNHDKVIITTIAKQAEFSYVGIKRLEEIERIHRIGRALVSSRKVNDVLKEIVMSVREVFQADLVVMYQFDHGKGKFSGLPLISGQSFEPQHVMRELTPNDAAYQIIKMKNSYFAPHAMDDRITSRKGYPLSKGTKEHFIFREGIVSSAAILLKDDKRAVGLMYINYRRSVKFNPEDKNLMEIFASYAATAIRAARDREEMTNQLTFSLSEIYNIGELIEGHIDTSRENEILEIVLNDILEFLDEDLGYYADYDASSKRITVRITSPKYKDLKNRSWSSNYGITGATIKSGDIRYLADITKSKKVIRFSAGDLEEFKSDVDKDVKSSISVPLIINNTKEGVFHIESNTLHNFSEQDIQIIKTLTDQAAKAIKNIRLIREKEHVQEQLNALHRLDRMIGLTWDLKAVLKFIMKLARGLTKNESVSGHISLVEIIDDREYLVPYAIFGEYTKSRLGRLSKSANKIALDDIKGITRRAVVKNEIIKLTAKDALWKKEYVAIVRKMKSELAVPLQVREKAIGVINVESPDLDAFDDEDAEWLKRLAGQAVVVIQMTKLVNDIRAIGLAGLSDHKRKFSKLILSKGRELLGAKDVVLWMFDADLDKFKMEDSLGVHDRIWDKYEDLGLNNSFVGDVLKKKTIMIADVQTIIKEGKYSRKNFVALRKNGLRTIVSVPFFSAKEYIGVMNFYLAEKLWPEKWNKSWEKTFLELFGTQVSIALQNVERHSKLQRANLKLNQSIDEEIFKNMSSMILLIHHRMNNSVGNIRLDVEELLIDDKHDAATRKLLHGVKDEAEKALDVPKEIDNVLRKLNAEKSEVGLLSLIEEILMDIPDDEFRFYYEGIESLPSVEGNSGILKEVIAEAIQNAMKSMPDGGKITFSGSVVQDRFVELVIEDRGHGIPKENLSKVFEYGFTQWKQGVVGKGDGLALAKTMIEAYHKGRISIESEADHGCKLKIKLPRFISQ